MNATAYDIQRWNRCKELAEDNEVTIIIRDYFMLSDNKGLSMGSLKSVDEVYGFLCGYEQGRSTKEEE